MMRRVMSLLANLLLLAVSLLGGLYGAELLARRYIPVSFVSATEEQAQKDENAAHNALGVKIADPRLLFRLAPNVPGHDSRGFRNATALDQADVVVVGDSQTWGINAPRDRSWPADLGARTGLSVYSMALGGWAPPQYAVLAEDAIALRPKAVLMGVYFGNDFAETCSYVYRNGATYAGLRGSAEGVIASSQELDRRLERYSEMSRDSLAKKKYQELALDPRRRLWVWLAGRFQLGRLAREYGLIPGQPSTAELYTLVTREWAEQNSEAGLVYDRGGVSTVLNFGYRLAVMDRSSTCVQEGIRISKVLLSETKAKLAAQGIGFGVVFIPTKEMVYAEADPAMLAKAPEMLRALAREETAIKRDLEQTCAGQSMVCVDALPYLAERARAGEVLYRQDSDGHPESAGYAVLAQAGLAALSRLGIGGGDVRKSAR